MNKRRHKNIYFISENVPCCRIGLPLCYNSINTFRKSILRALPHLGSGWVIVLRQHWPELWMISGGLEMEMIQPWQLLLFHSSCYPSGPALRTGNDKYYFIVVVFLALWQVLGRVGVGGEERFSHKSLWYWYLRAWVSHHSSLRCKWNYWLR